MSVLHDKIKRALARLAESEEPHPTVWDLAGRLEEEVATVGRALAELAKSLEVEWDECYDTAAGDYRRWRLMTPEDRANLTDVLRRMEPPAGRWASQRLIPRRVS